jgi:dTDP-4-amino-4,6-dideoxygalactose transaminase
VFVDVDPSTLTMDPARLEAALTPRTKAVIPVHLYGQPADMHPILEIARARGLAVIEDACQAHGARYRGQRVGGIGDFGCFSFYPAKNLGACGEGGAVVTRDAATAETMRMLRDWGQRRKYEHVLRGFNYRMDGVQGAVLRVKLRHLDGWNDARRAIADRYDLAFADTPVEPVTRAGYAQPVYHLYVIRHEARDALQVHLERHGIQTGLHYPHPVHLLEAYRDLGYAKGAFPVAEQAARTILSLPIYPEMPAAHVEAVIEAVRGYFAR